MKKRFRKMGELKKIIRRKKDIRYMLRLFDENMMKRGVIV